MSLSNFRMEQYIQKIMLSKTRPPERVEAYQASIKVLQEEGDIPTCCLDNSDTLLNALKLDIGSDVVKVSQESLHFLGIFLHSEKIIKSLDDNYLREIIDELCRLVLTSTEKTVCTRSLWCLARQKIPIHICVEKLDKIMELIEQHQDPKQTSSSLELEVVRVLNRLVLEMPDSLSSRFSWARRLYLATVHPATKVREAALIVLTAARPCLSEQHAQLLSTLVPDLKEILVPGLLKLFKEKNELFSLKLWNLLLEILGKTLHQGASLINNLLAIVEKAFKSPITEVKIEAFNSWQQLIKNFGTEMDVLANPKRLRLVMQPLKANNARNEQVACTKFRIWWYLTISLGPKLATNFETVMYPFLQFCFGLSEIACNQSILSTPNSMNASRASDAIQKINLNDSISSQSSPNMIQKFPVIHQLGCEALVHILGHNLDLPVTKPHLTIELLKYKVLEPPSLFIRHARVIILSTKEAILGIGSGKRNTHLQIYLWHCLVDHIKNNSEVENKKEFCEALGLFLNVLEDFVKHECNRVSPELALKLIEASTFMSEKLLHSSAYTIGAESVMNGTPALFVINLMFHSQILTLCTTERFGSTFHKLLFDGLNETATTLNFIQSVVKSIDSVADEIQHTDTLFHLWNTIAMALLSKIEKTREINQGDVLEHDFGCIYDMLIFPINRLFMKPLLQSNLNELTQNWSDLCQYLSRCSALITNIEANVWCEELCSKILNNVSQDSLNIPLMQENLSSILNTVVSAIDFSSISSINSVGSFNPSNWLARKHKRLGHFTSLVLLIDKLMVAIINSNLVPDDNCDTNKSNHCVCVSLTNMAQVILTLFTRITVTSFIGPLITQLIVPMANVFTAATRYESRDEQQDKLASKLEEMWNVATNVIQHGYMGTFDSEFLSVVSPLLEASLLYPRKPIRVKTRMLWHSTFARSPDTLTLPESFKTVLRRIRPSLVPGLSGDGEEALDDALLHSQENSDGGQHELIQTVPKISFNVATNSAADQAVVKTQPQKRPAIDEMSDQEFVKIMPDLKRKRILTERQKESLTTKKSALPAMYADLTQDSNVQLPAQFVDSESQLYSHQSSENNEMDQSAERTDLQQMSSSVTIIADKIVENAQQLVTDIPNLKSSDSSIELLNEVTKSVTNTINLVSQEPCAPVIQKTDMDILKQTDDEKLLAAPVLEIKRLSRKEIVQLSQHLSEESIENSIRSSTCEVSDGGTAGKISANDCVGNVEEVKRIEDDNSAVVDFPVSDCGLEVHASVKTSVESKSDQQEQFDNNAGIKVQESQGNQINAVTPKRAGRKSKKSVKLVMKSDRIISPKSDKQSETNKHGKPKSTDTLHSPVKTRSKRKSKLAGGDVQDVLREKSNDNKNQSTISQAQRKVDKLTSELNTDSESPTPQKKPKTARKSFQPVSPLQSLKLSSFSKSPDQSVKLEKQIKTSTSAKQTSDSRAKRTRHSLDFTKKPRKEQSHNLKPDQHRIKHAAIETETAVPSEKIEPMDTSNFTKSTNPNIAVLIKSPILHEVQLTRDNEVFSAENSEESILKTSDISTGEQEVNENNLELDKVEITTIPDSQEETREETETEVESQITPEIEPVTADYTESDSIASSVSLNATELNKIPLIGSEVTVDSEPQVTREDPVASKDNVIVFVADPAAVYTETVTSEVNVDTIQDSGKDIPAAPQSTTDEPAVEIKRIAFFPHKRHKLLVPREGTSSRGDDDTLSFIAHRNTKTYSRDSPRLQSSQENEPTSHTSAALMINSMPAISSLPASSPLMQRVGSRAVRMLEAANKHNLSQYEKLKYETKRSPDKSPDQKKLAMFKSTESLESPDRTQLCLKKLTDSKNSPSLSPSFGILKKRLSEKLLATTPPQANRRRVSFADPLVQGSAENAEKIESKQSVSRCLEMSKSDDSEKKKSSLPATSTSSDSMSTSDEAPVTITADSDDNATEDQGIAPLITTENHDLENSEISPIDSQAKMITEPSEEEVSELMDTSKSFSSSDFELTPIAEASLESQDENASIAEDTSTELEQNNEEALPGISEIVVNSFEEIGATAEIGVGMEEEKSIFNVVLEKNDKFEEIANLPIPLEVQQEVESRTDDDNSQIALNESENISRIIPEVQMEVLVPHMDSSIENEIVTAIEKDNAEVVDAESPSKALLDEATESTNDAEPTESTNDAEPPPEKKRRLDEDDEMFNFLGELRSKFTIDNLRKLPISRLLESQQHLCDMTMAVTNAIVSKHQEDCPN